MANIINASYFVGDIEIPNTAQDEIDADVLNSINLYEREVLIALLGYPLYKELQTWLTTPLVGDKFDKLVNGEEFSFVLDGETVTVQWDGLKGFEMKSLVAYYVYFMHRRKRSSYNAGVGIEVEADTDNSKPSSLYIKLIDVWNEFVLMYGGDCFPGDITLDLYEHTDSMASAYNYLLAKKADFPNWIFTSQGGELNKFGI